jgi:uncharacterized protein YyaL (SSP411 family)
MPNHLSKEKSPYLLQHAANPVDWHPWSDAAFAEARRTNKPIFLSVGYATCHWCHVMEKESFEDPDAAAALNDAFVCIKVDREERPDIDAVYMSACQMIAGRGGWPLTIVMTPDKKPFFAATYLPKTSRFGRLGLVELCRQIKGLWRKEPHRVRTASDQIMEHLNRAFDFKSEGRTAGLDVKLLDQATAQLSQSFDPQYGGFEDAPKFPTPHRLIFLLRSHHRTGDPKILEMVSKTLTAMRLGGLWDHVGFGFHRYSTDKQWRLPHFEKMLYDQSLLAMAYLEAYQVTAEPFFARTAREIFTYVLRDMTAAQGGFFSAEDADSEGEEGRFYLWDRQEFEGIAADASADIPWRRIFNLERDGNFYDEATGRKTGTNLLYMTRTRSQWLKELNREASLFDTQWEALRQALYNRRLQRPAPLKDDKILTDWNGLMIAALALGARVLDEDRYARAAGDAVAFIHRSLMGQNGRLLHRFRDGQAAIDAQAGDYAFLIMGLIELYRTTFDTDLLQQALRLQSRLDADFWDERQGGYFSTAAGDHDLPVRPKELYDGAMPSINSTALSNLLLLGRLTGDPRWDQRADGLTRSFAGRVNRHPLGFTHFLNGIDLALQPGQEVVVAGDLQAEDTKTLLKALRSGYAPHRVTMVKSNRNASDLSNLAGFTSRLSAEKGQATAHICTGFNCQNSTTDVTIMLNNLIERRSAK